MSDTNTDNKNKSFFEYLVTKDIFSVPIIIWLFFLLLVALAKLTMSNDTPDAKPVPTQVRYTQQDPSQQTEVLYSVVVDGKITNVTGIEWAMILLKENDRLVEKNNEYYSRDVNQRLRENQLHQDDLMNQKALEQKYNTSLSEKYQVYLSDINERDRQYKSKLLEQQLMYENQKLEVLKQCQN